MVANIAKLLIFIVHFTISSQLKAEDDSVQDNLAQILYRHLNKMPSDVKIENEQQEPLNNFKDKPEGRNNLLFVPLEDVETASLDEAISSDVESPNSLEELILKTEQQQQQTNKFQKILDDMDLKSNRITLLNNYDGEEWKQQNEKIKPFDPAITLLLSSNDASQPELFKQITAIPNQKFITHNPGYFITFKTDIADAVQDVANTLQQDSDDAEHANTLAKIASLLSDRKGRKYPSDQYRKLSSGKGQDSLIDRYSDVRCGCGGTGQENAVDKGIELRCGCGGKDRGNSINRETYLRCGCGGRGQQNAIDKETQLRCGCGGKHRHGSTDRDTELRNGKQQHLRCGGEKPGATPCYLVQKYWNMEKRKAKERRKIYKSPYAKTKYKYKSLRSFRDLIDALEDSENLDISDDFSPLLNEQTELKCGCGGRGQENAINKEELRCGCSGRGRDDSIDKETELRCGCGGRGQGNALDQSESRCGCGGRGRDDSIDKETELRCGCGGRGQEKAIDKEELRCGCGGTGRDDLIENETELRCGCGGRGQENAVDKGIELRYGCGGKDRGNSINRETDLRCGCGGRGQQNAIDKETQLRCGCGGKHRHGSTDRDTELRNGKQQHLRCGGEKPGATPCYLVQKYWNMEKRKAKERRKIYKSPYAKTKYKYKSLRSFRDLIDALKDSENLDISDDFSPLLNEQTELKCGCGGRGQENAINKEELRCGCSGRGRDDSIDKETELRCGCGGRGQGNALDQSESRCGCGGRGRDDSIDKETELRCGCGGRGQEKAIDKEELRCGCGGRGRDDSVDKETELRCGCGGRGQENAFDTEELRCGCGERGRDDSIDKETELRCGCGGRGQDNAIDKEELRCGCGGRGRDDSIDKETELRCGCGGRGQENAIDKEELRCGCGGRGRDDSIDKETELRCGCGGRGQENAIDKEELRCGCGGRGRDDSFHYKTDLRCSCDGRNEENYNAIDKEELRCGCGRKGRHDSTDKETELRCGCGGRVQGNAIVKNQLRCGCGGKDRDDSTDKETELRCGCGGRDQENAMDHSELRCGCGGRGRGNPIDKETDLRCGCGGRGQENYNAIEKKELRCGCGGKGRDDTTDKETELRCGCGGRGQENAINNEELRCGCSGRERDDSIDKETELRCGCGGRGQGNALDQSESRCGCGGRGQQNAIDKETQLRCGCGGKHRHGSTDRDTELRNGKQQHLRCGGEKPGATPCYLVQKYWNMEKRKAKERRKIYKSPYAKTKYKYKSLRSFRDLIDALEDSENLDISDDFSPLLNEQTEFKCGCGSRGQENAFDKETELRCGCGGRGRYNSLDRETELRCGCGGRGQDYLFDKETESDLLTNKQYKNKVSNQNSKNILSKKYSNLIANTLLGKIIMTLYQNIHTDESFEETANNWPTDAGVAIPNEIQNEDDLTRHEDKKLSDDKTLRLTKGKMLQLRPLYSLVNDDTTAFTAKVPELMHKQFRDTKENYKIIPAITAKLKANEKSKSLIKSDFDDPENYFEFFKSSGTPEITKSDHLKVNVHNLLKQYFQEDSFIKYNSAEALNGARESILNSLNSTDNSLNSFHENQKDRSGNLNEDWSRDETKHTNHWINKYIYKNRQNIGKTKPVRNIFKQGYQGENNVLKIPRLDDFIVKQLIQEMKSKNQDGETKNIDFKNLKSNSHYKNIKMDTNKNNHYLKHIPMILDSLSENQNEATSEKVYYKGISLSELNNFPKYVDNRNSNERNIKTVSKKHWKIQQSHVPQDVKDYMNELQMTKNGLLNTIPDISHSDRSQYEFDSESLNFVESVIGKLKNKYNLPQNMKAVIIDAGDLENEHHINNDESSPELSYWREGNKINYNLKPAYNGVSVEDTADDSTATLNAKQLNRTMNIDLVKKSLVSDVLAYVQKKTLTLPLFLHNRQRQALKKLTESKQKLSFTEKELEAQIYDLLFGEAEERKKKHEDMHLKKRQNPFNEPKLKHVGRMGIVSPREQLKQKKVHVVVGINSAPKRKLVHRKVPHSRRKSDNTPSQAYGIPFEMDLQLLGLAN